jgi:hypothetical protein
MANFCCICNKGLQRYSGLNVRSCRLASRGTSTRRRHACNKSLSKRRRPHRLRRAASIFAMSIFPMSIIAVKTLAAVADNRLPVAIRFLLRVRRDLEGGVKEQADAPSRVGFDARVELIGICC